MEEFENLWEHERPVSHLERAARLDREFLEPRVWLLPLYWELCVGQSDSPRCSDFESLMNELGASPESLSPVGRIVVRGHEARLRGHSVLALRVLRDLLDLAPDDPGLRWLVADAALRARRYEEAVEILEPFDENGPEAAWFRKPRAKVLEDAYHMTGNYLAEEDLARRTADAYPDDGFVRRRLARSLAAQGRIEEVSALVDQTFAEDNVFNLVDFLLVAGTELRVHGWREPSLRAGERWLEWLEAQEAEGPVKEEEPRVLLRTCRARALELADRQEEAREEWTSLAAESWEPNAFTRLFRLTPSFFLSRTALAAARDGDGEEAREAAALLAGKGGTYSYGSRSLFHAELASLLGDRDAAIAALRQALREGYPYPLSLHRDAAFDPIRGDEEFEELVYPED